MKYIAILKVGDYEVGDEVPEDKAKIYLEMYSVPHIKVVEDDHVHKKVEKSEKEIKKEKEVEKKEEEHEFWMDDYLARNKHVVVKALEEDEKPFSEVQMKMLVELETKGKNRKKVLAALKEKKAKDKVEDNGSE